MEPLITRLPQSPHGILRLDRAPRTAISGIGDRWGLLVLQPDSRGIRVDMGSVPPAQARCRPWADGAVSPRSAGAEALQGALQGLARLLQQGDDDLVHARHRQRVVHRDRRLELMPHHQRQGGLHLPGDGALPMRHQLKPSCELALPAAEARP